MRRRPGGPSHRSSAGARRASFRGWRRGNYGPDGRRRPWYHFNAIAPGYFETELTRQFLASDAGEKPRRRIPTRRVGRLQGLDGLLLLLASDLANVRTGAVIPVDGGHLLASL
ncbi:SDR family oxidoreductase [Xanthobacter sp. KR7-225]|uniref:SDR family oxidoreductase n=1 Tax=Xanthobacter sp. KR7-225 TaxID=3156613 RepID=UPI0032B3DC2B